MGESSCLRSVSTPSACCYSIGTLRSFPDSDLRTKEATCVWLPPRPRSRLSHCCTMSRYDTAQSNETCTLMLFCETYLLFACTGPDMSCCIFSSPSSCLGLTAEVPSVAISPGTCNELHTPCDPFGPRARVLCVQPSGSKRSVYPTIDVAGPYPGFRIETPLESKRIIGL